MFLFEVLVCPHCRGKRRVLAGICDPDSIARILTHLGLPTEPPVIAEARASLQLLLPW